MDDADRTRERLKEVEEENARLSQELSEAVLDASNVLRAELDEIAKTVHREGASSALSTVRVEFARLQKGNERLRQTIAQLHEEGSEIVLDDQPDEPSGAWLRGTPDLPEKVRELKEESDRLRLQLKEMARLATEYREERDRLTAQIEEMAGIAKSYREERNALAVRMDALQSTVETAMKLRDGYRQENKRLRRKIEGLQANLETARENLEFFQSSEAEKAHQATVHQALDRQMAAEEENERLKVELKEALDDASCAISFEEHESRRADRAEAIVVEFQIASGLCVPSENQDGDPGGVEPKHVRAEMERFRSRLERAEKVIATAFMLAHEADQLGPTNDDRFHVILETLREFDAAGEQPAEHHEFCDTRIPGPDLAPSTKPCNCRESFRAARAQAFDNKATERPVDGGRDE